MTTVLAVYPLTSSFRLELEQRFGPIDVVTIAELRRLGAPAFLRRLRRMNGTVVLATEGRSSAGLPALQAAAALTSAERRLLVQPGAESQQVRRAAALESLARSAGASADGLAALARVDRAARRLLSLPRRPAVVQLDRGLLLLNSSAWLGLAQGGAVAHTVGLANAFADEGIATTVATYTETPGMRTSIARRQLPAPTSFAVPPELNRFRLARTAETVEVEEGVVYERLALGSVAGALASVRAGVPLVVEYNGSELWAAKNWGGTRRFEGTSQRAELATLRHAHLVVTVSEPLHDELVARGIEEARIVCHPNGVDPDRFDPNGDARSVRERFAIPPDVVLVTFVGTFGAWHGAEVLARVARTSRLHFLFVGDGARRREVDALADGRANVTLPGSLPFDEIPAVLAASDILVAPHVPNPDGTRFFGSPTKLFEYMAAGRAIVASRLDQIAEVLADGAGVLVTPGDEYELGAALDALADDVPARRKLGAVARGRVVERYTWRHHARVILDALAVVTTEV